MKLKIEIAGKKREVECTPTGERSIWTIDGRRLEADAIVVSPGLYSILIGGHSFEVRVERLGAELRALQVDGNSSSRFRTRVNGVAIGGERAKPTALSRYWHRCPGKSSGFW